MLKQIYPDIANRYEPLTTRLKFGERCFSHAGPRAWNELPTQLQDVTDHSAFICQLKTFLFERAFTTQWQSCRWSLRCKRWTDCISFCIFASQCKTTTYSTTMPRLSNGIHTFNKIIYRQRAARGSAITTHGWDRHRPSFSILRPNTANNPDAT